jgi:SAM-dependent methyltransferase
MSIHHIDSALVEDTKPMMYQMHRWVGRKPSNIWREYIETYTKPGEIVLDAMCGSGIAPIEAVVSGRKGIGFDQDPMAIFVSENIANFFDKDEVQTTWNNLKTDFESFESLHPIYTTTCTGGRICTTRGVQQVSGCNRTNVRIDNFRFNTGTANATAIPSEIVYSCSCQDTYILKNADESDLDNYSQFEIPPDVEWYPTKEVPQTEMFDGVRQKYGVTYDKFWSSQNLYLLAYIFSKINEIDVGLRDLFKFAFTSTVHLASKIPASRAIETCRLGAGSLGRPTLDLLIAERMEQNPFVLFERAIESKQGILNGKFSKSETPSVFCKCDDCDVEFPFAKSVTSSNLPPCKDCRGVLKRKKQYTSSSKRVGSITFADNYEELISENEPKDIFLKKLNIRDVHTELPESSVDFIITDPPYGGLVGYMGISSIWSVWLEGSDGDDHFVPSFDHEITIDATRNFDIGYYQRCLNQAFREYFHVLKPNRYMVVTFHNKEPRIYNALRIACQNAGFITEHLHFQQNLRAGETGSANPAGTANSDFYFRFRKPKNHKVLKTPAKDIFEKIVVRSISKGLAEIAEETTIAELLPGLLKELNSQGYALEFESDEQIEEILKKHSDIFEKVEKKWWLTEEFKKAHRLNISPLDERIDKAIIETLRQQPSSLDEILATLFTKFQDTYTPNEKIVDVIKDYADWNEDIGKWVLNPEEDLLARQSDSEHSKKQIRLAEIGIKKGYKIWCPKPDTGKSVAMKKLCLNDFPINNLKNVGDVKLIDVLWIKNNKIEYAFEVENSTTMTSALERCDYLPDSSTKKVMVLPCLRKTKLAKKMKNTIFKSFYNSQKWKHIFYEDLDSMKGSDIEKIMK